MDSYFEKRLNQLQQENDNLLARSNRMLESGNGIFNRYEYPVLTAAHTPIDWRFDVDPISNPLL